MIIDVPHWVCHGHTDGISAVDIHPSGRRLVTCGSSPQIKIWNLAPVLDPAAEDDPNVPKLLAMLSEHQSDAGVQIARFNHSGSILASGGSDNIVLLYKLSPTPASATLGSTWVNKENWRAVGSLRGPSLDVTGLSWSKDDKQLATCSMDGSIYIYSMTAEGQGTLIHTIRNQHYGWVKGVAFDPVGRYLASHGRNGVKVWDVQKDWALAQHMKQAFERAPESAFRLSLTWAPDGDLLIAPNSSDKGKPTTVVFKRQEWDSYQLVGHRSSVAAAVANPRLFYPPKALLAVRSRLQERMQAGVQGNETDEGLNDAAAAVVDVLEQGYEDRPMTVLACGANDKTYTVWGTETALPLIHVSQVHSGPVTDFCWTPDGHTLIAASSDDSISIIRFSEAELGKAMTDEQFKEHMQSEYGGAAAGTEAAAAAQDPELAMLAATNGAVTTAAAAAATVALPAAAVSAAAPRRVAPQPIGASGSGAAAAAGSGKGMLDRRIMPTGVGVTTGTLQQQQQQQQQLAGKKRVYPTAVQPSTATGPAAKRQAVSAATAPTATQQQQQQQHAVRPVGKPAAGRWPLGTPAVVGLLQSQLAILSSGVLVLSVKNSGGGGAAVADVTLTLSQGQQAECFWRDKIQGQVVAIAGTCFFLAAATTTGLLHVWRPGGNMMLPPVALGCPPISLTAHGDYELQVVGADGEFYLLDLNSGCRPLGPTPSANIAPLLTVTPPGTTLREAWISGSVLPQQPQQRQQQQQQLVPMCHMATLTDGSGWMFHNKLGLWMQLQPGAHDQRYLPLPRVAAFGTPGDTEKLQAASAEAAAAGLKSPATSATVPPVFRRQGAEQQLLSATLLANPGEYQRCLGVLVTALCQSKEETRLKELAQDLLGPERWTPAWGSNPWDHLVLGMDKRQLLRTAVIPVMASFGLKLVTQIRDALVVAEQHVRQYTQQQQAAQPLLGVGRLGPHGLPMGGLTVSQHMMQAYHQQQQPALYQQQSMPLHHQQQQAPGVVNGFGPAAAANGMNGCMQRAQGAAQQQQGCEHQVLEASGSEQPAADAAAGSGVGARMVPATAPPSATPAAPTGPRRIQPQAVAAQASNMSPVHTQEHEDLSTDQDVGAAAVGRQPLQQVSLGQQAAAHGAQHVANKPQGSRGDSAGRAVAGQEGQQV